MNKPLQALTLIAALGFSGTASAAFMISSNSTVTQLVGCCTYNNTQQSDASNSVYKLDASSAAVLDANNLARSYVQGSATSVQAKMGAEVRVDAVGDSANARAAHQEDWVTPGYYAPGLLASAMGFIPSQANIALNGTWSPTNNYMDMSYRYEVYDAAAGTTPRFGFYFNFYNDAGYMGMSANISEYGIGNTNIPISYTIDANGNFAISQNFSFNLGLKSISGSVSEDLLVRLDGDGAPRFLDFYHTFDTSLTSTDPNVQIVSAPVPVPAAAWLFGSGLLGLVGVARRKKSGQ